MAAEQPHPASLTGGDPTAGPAASGLREIQSAWLVLSHGPWFTVSIAAAGLATTIFTFADPGFTPMAIGWFATSLVLLSWVFYSVWKTWKACKQFPDPIFPDSAFLYLYFMLATVLALIVWTMTIVILDSL